MTTTYYLLRSKGTAVGDGPYLGIDVNGKAALVPHNTQGLRFDTLPAAEQYIADTAAELGEFEIEIRNSTESDAVSA